MPEQLSPLARRDRNPLSMDAHRTRTPLHKGSSGGGPDPLLLTITGVLLFVVVMLVIVFRTLYPGST